MAAQRQGNQFDEIEISVILPVRNEEHNVEKTVDELMPVLDKLGKPYEVIAINVPARDNSYAAVERLGNKYTHFYPVNARYLHVTSLQKGYQYALGFAMARGLTIIQMDTDYQDDPNDLPKFVKKIDEGFDCVVGWKQNRKDSFFYMLTSKIQNMVSRIVSGVPVHDKNCGFKAYTRAAAKALVLYGSNYRDIPMQLQSKGYRVTEIPVDNRKRLSGTNNFKFMNRLIGGTLDFTAATLISLMREAPFRLWGGIGMACIACGKLALLVFAIWVLLTGGSIGLNWWALLWLITAVLSVISGIAFLAIGVVAEYLRSRQPFSLDAYQILADPKRRVRSV